MHVVACKIPVHKYSNGLDFEGDAVAAYPVEMHLGTMIERVGSNFYFIEISDREYDHPDIENLLGYVDDVSAGFNRNKNLNIKGIPKPIRNQMEYPSRLVVTYAEALAYVESKV